MPSGSGRITTFYHYAKNLSGSFCNFLFRSVLPDTGPGARKVHTSEISGVKTTLHHAQLKLPM